jgi:putative peptidoglycan lipid II flippase
MASPPPDTSDSRRYLVKSAALITMLTFLSRILGLVREQVRGYYLGTGTASDAFGLAATIPNLFRRLLAEGAMTAAFIPVFTGYVKGGDRKALSAFFSNFISLFTFITTIVCLLGMVYADFIVNTFFSSGFGEIEGKLALTILLTRIMFPYLLLVSLAAIIQAVLNSFRIFAPSAFTPVLLNICIILGAVLLQDLFPDPSYAFAVGFLAGGVAQLLFQLPWFFRLGLRVSLSVNWRHPGVRELFRIFVPGAFAAGIYQINVFVSQMIASSLYEGSIAALQYSVRLQELVLGVFVVSVTTVILPTLARQHAAGDRKGFTGTNLLALDMMALVTVPASLGLLALRRPIIQLLFQQGEFDAHSTDLTSLAVLFHSMGIYFIASSRSLNQTFYAMKDLKTPMVVAAIAMGVNIGGCYGLAIPLGHGGIALANSLSALATSGLLFLFLFRRGVEVRFQSHAWLLLRLLLAGGIMVAALLVLQSWLPQASEGKLYLALRLLLLVVSGGAVFVLAALLVARKELLRLLLLVTRRGSSGDTPAQ